MKDELLLRPATDEMLDLHVEQVTSSVVAVRARSTDYHPETTVFEPLGTLLVRSRVLSSTELTFDARSGRLLEAQILVDEASELAEVRPRLPGQYGLPRAEPAFWRDSDEVRWAIPETLALNGSRLSVVFGLADAKGARWCEGGAFAMLVNESSSLCGIEFTDLSSEDIALLRSLAPSRE
jgi:hypothetical protein